MQAQGLHGPGGHIPDFATLPTKVSVMNGRWSSPATWGGPVPTASDIVQVRHDVAFDTDSGVADIVSVEPGGALRFRNDQHTHLSVGILVVKPATPLKLGGVLEIGTVTDPVWPEFRAEIVITNRPLNLVTDPEEWGTGLLVAGGQVKMHGAVKRPTFIRTREEPLAGHSVIYLEQPAQGWRVGDEVFLPDTTHVGEMFKFGRFNDDFTAFFDPLDAALRAKDHPGHLCGRPRHHADRSAALRPPRCA